MKKLITPRLAWLIWAGALALFLILVSYPVSYRITRALSVVLIGGIWFGLLALNWRWQAVRWL